MTVTSPTPKTLEQTIQAELRIRGVGLLLAGIVLFIFWREPLNLVVLGILGLLNLAFPKRPMFIVNGALFILIALINVLASIASIMLAPGQDFNWTIIIVTIMLQFGWGAQEFEKFARFGPKTPEYQLLIKKLNTPYETARVLAAQELGKLDFSNEEIVRELQAATQDEYTSVRRAATEALKAHPHAAFLEDKSSLKQ